MKANTAFGYQANSVVRLGLLGCGNRGTSVATSFSQNTSAQVVAAVTRTSLDRLQLEPGSKASAYIKATELTLGR